MLRHLRIVAASFFCVASFMLAALWVRSYSYRETLQGPPLTAFSLRGRISLRFDKPTDDRMSRRWLTKSWSYESLEEMLRFLSDAREKPGLMEFACEYDSQSRLRITLPHWFAMMLAAWLAVVLKPQPRLRFSLLEVWVLTTVAAVVMGGLLVFVRLTGS